nr:MAG TPA: hypothetical protein [Caudoviricetes sp.]
MYNRTNTHMYTTFNKQKIKGHNINKNSIESEQPTLLFM